MEEHNLGERTWPREKRSLAQRVLRGGDQHGQVYTFAGSRPLNDKPGLMAIYDTILWLESQATGRRFPTVLFSADTDMATEGWESLTSIHRHEIVVTQLTAEEFQATASDPSAYVQVENRVNAILGRDDLRVPWLARIEERGSPAVGLSFLGFWKGDRPPRLLIGTSSLWTLFPRSCSGCREKNLSVAAAGW